MQGMSLLLLVLDEWIFGIWNNDISLFNKKENKEDPEKMLYIFKQYSIGGRHSIRPRYSGDDNIMLT